MFGVVCRSSFLESTVKMNRESTTHGIGLVERLSSIQYRTELSNGTEQKLNQ